MISYKKSINILKKSKIRIGDEILKVTDCLNRVSSNNVYFENIGSTQKSHLEIKNEMKIDLNTLFKANNEWYNNY